jgi:hypothetical protein
LFLSCAHYKKEVESRQASACARLFLLSVDESSRSIKKLKRTKKREKSPKEMMEKGDKNNLKRWNRLDI